MMKDLTGMTSRDVENGSWMIWKSTSTNILRNNMGTNSTAATVKAVNILMKGGYRSGDTISYDDALGMLVEVIMKSTF